MQFGCFAEKGVYLFGIIYYFLRIFGGRDRWGRLKDQMQLHGGRTTEQSTPDSLLLFLE